MKEQEKSPEKINEMEEHNLPDTEFKTIIITMLKELRKKIEELGDNINKDTVVLQNDIKRK